MKSPAVMLSLAISAIALSSEFTTASATKMDGKCCQSSDGGRSNRYHRVVRRAAMRKVVVAPTCSARAASCIRVSSTRTDRVSMCMTAKAQCLQTGVYVGPYSGRQFAGMQRK